MVSDQAGSGWRGLEGSLLAMPEGKGGAKAMNEQLNIVLNVDGTNYCIETNLNLRAKPHELYAQIWHHVDGHMLADHVHTERGPHALTDAVLWLSDLLKEPVAHKLKKQERSEIWL